MENRYFARLALEGQGLEPAGLSPPLWTCCVTLSIPVFFVQPCGCMLAVFVKMPRVHLAYSGAFGRCEASTTAESPSLIVSRKHVDLVGIESGVFLNKREN